MEKQLQRCPNLTERDVALLHRIAAGLPITADVSRADVLLFCALGRNRMLVAYHAVPQSMSSIYVENATGREFTPEEQPLVHRALAEDRGGRRAKQVISSGAPVIQQVFPVHNAANRVIAAMLVETNMIEYERQRRRAKAFQRAVRWLQEMAIRGEIEIPEPLSRFGSLDGIYLVDERSCIRYVSGIGTNLFRSIGLMSDVRGQHVSVLEPIDEELVSQAMQAGRCVEQRQETADGRVWVRTVIPLRAPRTSWQALRRRLLHRLPWISHNGHDALPQADGALVLIHNETEAVQQQRQLNVKSAMIQEVHHRVKNNLQTMAAILRMQARRCESEEARQHLNDAVNRVLSMSIIHEYLSQDEQRPINIKDACQRIVAQTQQVAVGPDQQIDITIRGPNIRLPANQATATALVMNELLLNAIEHGLQGRDRGRVSILLEDKGDAVRLVVEDDGPGVPADFSPSQSRSMGLQIIHTLVHDDLKGVLQFESAQTPVTPSGEEAAPGTLGGARVIVTFPK